MNDSKLSDDWLMVQESASVLVSEWVCVCVYVWVYKCVRQCVRLCTREMKSLNISIDDCCENFEGISTLSLKWRETFIAAKLLNFPQM